MPLAIYIEDVKDSYTDYAVVQLHFNLQGIWHDLPNAREEYIYFSCTVLLYEKHQ